MPISYTTGLTRSREGREELNTNYRLAGVSVALIGRPHYPFKQFAADPR